MKALLIAVPAGVFFVICLFVIIAAMIVSTLLYYVFYKPLKGYIAYTAAVKKGDREYPGAGSFYITETGNIVSYEREGKV